MSSVYSKWNIIRHGFPCRVQKNGSHIWTDYIRNGFCVRERIRLMILCKRDVSQLGWQINFWLILLSDMNVLRQRRKEILRNVYDHAKTRELFFPWSQWTATGRKAYGTFPRPSQRYIVCDSQFRSSYYTTYCLEKRESWSNAHAFLLKFLVGNHSCFDVNFLSGKFAGAKEIRLRRSKCTAKIKDARKREEVNDQTHCCRLKSKKNIAAITKTPHY